MLLKSGYYQGAYYLAGYAVECAFKACVAGLVKEDVIPDKKFVNDSYTHNFDRLLSVSGLEPDLNAKKEKNEQFDRYWSFLKDWSAEDRYEVDIDEQSARDLLEAVGDHDNGILKWLKEKW